jgi:hypothetical protein
MQRVDDAFKAGGDFSDYRKENPLGLTREGAVALSSYLLFGGTPFGGLKMAKPDLNDTEVSYEPLVPWEVRGK